MYHMGEGDWKNISLEDPTKQLEKRSMDENFVNQTLQQVPLPFYIF